MSPKLCKGSKIESQLLLINNRQSHMHFHRVPQSVTMDDQWPLHTYCAIMHGFFRAHHANFSQYRPIPSVTVMYPMDSLVYGNVRFWIFFGVP